MRTKVVIGALLVAVTFLAYGRLLGNPFISLDDRLYITENRHVLGGITAEGVRWAFTATDGGNWHPLTWLSHMLDGQLYGADPAGHRATALLLHAANTLLVFLLLAAATGKAWQSAFVAALFALHPLRVESVAWASERKDLLSAFFGLSAIAAYGRYAAGPSFRRYLPVLLLFACSLMSKPMLVTLPLLLLVIDFWPLGRFESASPRNRAMLLVEKVPLVLLSAVISLLAVSTQGKGVSRIDLWPRIANAIESAAGYLGKSLWPANLAFIYPHPGPRVDLLPLLAATTLLAALTVVAARGITRRPWLAAGWCWYLVSLLPVIGLIQVGLQSMADRYTYLPLLGPSVMLTWTLGEVVRARRVPAAAVGAAALLLLAALGALTWRQLGYWRDSESLYRRAAAAVPENWIAHFYLGDLRMSEGRNAAAIEEFRKATAIKSDYPSLQILLGVAHWRLGEREEAIAAFSRAIRLEPGNVDALYNLGLVTAEAGRREEAVRLFIEARRLPVRNPSMVLDLGNALLRLKEYGEAAAALSDAARLLPDNPQAHHNLGSALAALGRGEEAVGQFREAIRLDPSDKNAWNNLGIALAGLGRREEAIRAFGEALSRDPLFEDARYNLEMARSGRR